jgi:hypothetical protein
LDQALRSQNLRGTAYSSLAGDASLDERLNKESMPLHGQDVMPRPRAMPVLHRSMKEHGTYMLPFFISFFSVFFNTLRPLLTVKT